MLKLAARGYDVMHARRRWHAVVAVMAIPLVACGGDSSGPPQPGSIQVSVATSGFFKPDSYELVVNGAVKQTIGANDKNVTLAAMDPGSHLVSLGGVPANCSSAAATVAVESVATAEVSLDVTCTFAQPAAYSIKFTNDRPNLETGEVVACTFGLCPTGSVWDLYAHQNTATEPRTEIRHNDKTVQIAHVKGVTLSTLTEAHVSAASFTVSLIQEPFTSDRVILIRRNSGGSIYALGNPSEDLAAQRAAFQAALIQP
jgi:hypothetical protein